MPMTMIHARPGYVFLVSVLVIGVIATATATSLMLLAWAAEQNGFLVMRSAQAYEYANICAERGLKELRRDLNFGGSVTYTFDQGSCAINSIGGEGMEERFLCVSGYSGDITRRLQISIDRLFPSVVIRSWKEVSDFTLCL